MLKLRDSFITSCDIRLLLGNSVMIGMGEFL